MRIRTNIFVWVFVATILPLTALALGATYYSEYSHKRAVHEDVMTNLNSIAGELKRQVQSYESLTLGLSQAQSVQEFLPLLDRMSRGQINQDINIYRSRLNHFFEGFQTILPGTFFFRLLDQSGNTLIKVNHQRRSPALYEGVQGIAYVEQELGDNVFTQLLRELPRGEVSVLNLPHNRMQSELFTMLAVQDFVVPLYWQDRFVGALTVTLLGDEIDRIMHHATRSFQGKLSIIENNPEDLFRHTSVLYDDINNIQFSQLRANPAYTKDIFVQGFFDGLGSREIDVTNSQLRGLYFIELFPYQSRLTNWFLISKIDTTQVAAPFVQIRSIIWLCAGLALIISLLLANIGVRNIARPLGDMAKRLREYANGQQDLRVERRQRIDEIASLAGAFNYMAETLDTATHERDKAQNMMLQSAKLASIGEMAAGIGHEINNPLNNILSYAKLLERNLGETDGHLREDLRSLREEALRASDIVTGILNFSRQVPPRYSRFNVRDWLESTLTLVRQTAMDKDVTVTLEPLVDITIDGDPVQLQQAMINLLLNAIQASPIHSAVQVRVRSGKDVICIAVIDQGSGIEEEILDKVFDPFFTTKEEGQGSGLGLSITHGIVEHHHGRLTLVNNVEGAGACAEICLPCTR